MKIKDKNLLIANYNNEKWDTYIFKNDVKLGEAIEFLPSGIINKNITGIGATTLEIKSHRHSIIVEPLRSIAYSKAGKHHHCLYVGGHKTKKGTSHEEIKRYDQSDVPYKKFIVVADSLPRLLNTLGENVYEKYFIMIDEIDSFQLDSGFRENLESCLDYYKLFPKEQRALVSSTIMDFSDPDLKEERCYAFDYQNKQSRNIDLCYSENVKGAAVEGIDEIYNRSEDKILIAYNTVDGCKAMAYQLITDFNIPKEEIKIYCSPKRQDDVFEFFAELEDGKLGGRINFITSAYFVGVDIEDKYHSIAICNPEIKQTLLSLNRLKQIVGRGRNGVLSETIFYNATHYLHSDQIPLDILLNSARTKIKALDCIINNYKNDQVLAKMIIDVRNSIIGKDDVFGYNLVRTDINEELSISYFNIDSCIDTMNTSKFIYSDIETIQYLLENDGHKVDLDIKTSALSVANKPEDEEFESELIGTAIKLLQELDRPQDARELLLKSRSRIQSTIYERYLAFYKYFPNKPEVLYDKLVELSSKNIKAFKQFKLRVDFIDPDIPLRQLADALFPIGSEFTPQEILDNLNKIYSNLGWSKVNESTTTAVQVLRSLYKVKPIRRRTKQGLPLHLIMGHHPHPEEIEAKAVPMAKNINTRNKPERVEGSKAR